MGPHCCMEGMQYTLQVPRSEPEMGDGDLIRDYYRGNGLRAMILKVCSLGQHSSWGLAILSPNQDVLIILWGGSFSVYNLFSAQGEENILLL